MQCGKLILSLKLLIRTFSTSSCYQQVNMKQVKMMKKIMVGREKGKRRYHLEEYPKMITAEKLSNPERQGKEGNRRITVLNKLFMKNVTDLMASGIFAEKLFGHGIQISTVKIAADFKKLNIFWFGKITERDELIDATLKSIAGPLRHELSVLRLMGEVPQINFCRDRQFAKSSIIDSLLIKADFGEEFVPSDPTFFMKPETQLEMKLPDELRQKIRELDSIDDSEGVEEEEEKVEVEHPPMRNDIFGLDHARIMGSIVASIDKSSRAWDSFNNENFETERTEIIKNIQVDISKLAKEATNRAEFVKFLEKRQFEKKSTPERKKFNKRLVYRNEDDNFYDDSDTIPDNDLVLEDDDFNRKL